jgi:hypothetical protein
MRTRARCSTGSAIGWGLQSATGCIAPPSGHANLTQLGQAVDGAAQRPSCCRHCLGNGRRVEGRCSPRLPQLATPRCVEVLGCLSPSIAIPTPCTLEVCGPSIVGRAAHRRPSLAQTRSRCCNELAAQVRRCRWADTSLLSRNLAQEDPAAPPRSWPAVETMSCPLGNESGFSAAPFATRAKWPASRNATRLRGTLSIRCAAQRLTE